MTLTLKKKKKKIGDPDKRGHRGSTHQLERNVYVTARCRNPHHTLGQFIQEWFNCILYVAVTRAPVTTLYGGDTHVDLCHEYGLRWVCACVCTGGCGALNKKRHKQVLDSLFADDAAAAAGFMSCMQKVLGVFGKGRQYGGQKGPNECMCGNNANSQTQVYHEVLKSDCGANDSNSQQDR